MIYCQNKRELVVNVNKEIYLNVKNLASCSSWFFSFSLSYRLVKTGEYNPSRYPFIATFSLNDREGNGLNDE